MKISTRRQHSKRSKKLGLAPGEIAFFGEERSTPIEISLISYSSHEIIERKLDSKLFTNIADRQALDKALGKNAASSQSKTIDWINVDGVHASEIVKNIGASVGLHPLTLEDILTTDQRPRREEYPDYIYIVVKMLNINQEKELIEEQVSFVMLGDTLITFQELKHPGDVFDPVRTRLRNMLGKLRFEGIDYLLYALLDCIVDRYFSIIEQTGEEVEQIEADIISNPKSEMLTQLYNLKRVLRSLRRSSWPLRELINSLCHEQSNKFKASTVFYMRDLYTHIIQIIDQLELQRETLSSLLDVYLSSVSNRLNSVMKILTLVTTIFMPLSLIAGIYGMNFEHMPELKWKYGYAYSLCVMLLVAFSMIFIFKRKKLI